MAVFLGRLSQGRVAVVMGEEARRLGKKSSQNYGRGFAVTSGSI
jgi:hypothetical protein